MPDLSHASPTSPDAGTIAVWRERIRAQTSSHYQFHMGWALESQDRHLAAIWFRRAFDTDPDQFCAGVHLASLLTESGDVAAADEVRQRLRQRNPDYQAIANAMEIQALLDCGQTEKAVKAITAPELVTTGAGDLIAAVALRLGQTLRSTGRLTDAVGIFDIALSLEPDSLEAAQAAIETELQMSHLHSAVARIGAALQFHPGSVPLKRLRISANLNLGIPIQQDIEAILAVSPDDPHIRRIAASQALIKGDAADALSEFTRLLERTSQASEICMLGILKGHALFALGKLPEALQSFQKAVDISASRDGVCLAMAAYTTAALGQRNEAAALAQTTVKLLQQSAAPNIWALLALTLTFQLLGYNQEVAKYAEQCRVNASRLTYVSGLFPWAKEKIEAIFSGMTSS